MLRIATVTAMLLPLTLAVANAQTASPDATPSPQRFITRFNAANTTHDGKLTEQQAAAGNLSWISRHFAEIDAQHKGYVTLQDLRAYRQHARQQRQDGQGDPG